MLSSCRRRALSLLSGLQTSSTPFDSFIRTTTAYTVGSSTNIKWHEGMVPKEDKEVLLGQRGCVVWFTGLSGSGKSTVACTLEHALKERGTGV
jgi:pantothenate kinase-related protein Tda10